MLFLIYYTENKVYEFSYNANKYIGTIKVNGVSTYSYYYDKVKPKPETDGKKGFVCKVCGYVYEGDELPEDFVCPLCKHGAADFEEIK